MLMPTHKLVVGMSGRVNWVIWRLWHHISEKCTLFGAEIENAPTLGLWQGSENPDFGTNLSFSNSTDIYLSSKTKIKLIHQKQNCFQSIKKNYVFFYFEATLGGPALNWFHPKTTFFSHCCETKLIPSVFVDLAEIRWCQDDTLAIPSVF